VSGTHPTGAHRYGAIIDPGDAQLLEALDAAHDVDERIDCPQLVEMHLVRRQAVNPSLRLTQELKRPQRPLPHPVGEIRSLYDREQLADVAVGPVVLGVLPVAMVVIMLVIIHDRRRLFPRPIGQTDVYLDRAYAATIDHSDLHCDIGKP
jgi:hypothetical protein